MERVGIPIEWSCAPLADVEGWIVRAAIVYGEDMLEFHLPIVDPEMLWNEGAVRMLSLCVSCSFSCGLAALVMQRQVDLATAERSLIEVVN